MSLENEDHLVRLENLDDLEMMACLVLLEREVKEDLLASLEVKDQ